MTARYFKSYRSGFGIFATARRTLLGFCLFIGCVTAGAEEPPRVVRTVPENGAQSVDVATMELRVTFDQPMDTKRGYSFVILGSKFVLPEVAGKPQWISDTTIVLPVKLKPNREYGLGINSERHQNFRGTNGLPAVPYPLSFRTAPSGDMKPLDPEQNRKSLEQLRSAIEEKYSYRDLRGIDWDVRFAEFEPRLVDTKTSRQFAFLAGQLLEVARDAHIKVNVDGDRLAGFQRSVRPNVDRELLKRIVSQFRSVNRAVVTGRFPDGPAYLMIRSWSPKAARDIEAAAKWIDELSLDDTLILDIRFNSGGDERLARKIAGRFVDQSVVYAGHLNRDVSSPSGFSEINKRTLKPIRPGFRGRTVVLMGPVNMSSCEAFLLMMKQAPQCTLMGEKSYGSSGNPKPVRLANGVTVFLPSWVALTPDGEPFEGKGISPDVYVEFPDEPGDQDPLINAALELLKKGQG
ncbi:MAG: S41 family peptidase [Gemmatimonadetes bacterium]|nr:S41 family peptidase [Gemmatimonadota bacterium]